MRGNDERDNPKRRPIAVQDINNPGVFWVNFANPSELHPSVIEYAENLRRKKGMQDHPSNQPKDDK